MVRSKNKKKKSSNNILSFLITALVISLILIAGPAQALTLNLSANASSVSKGTNVELTADIDINSSETLNINEITLELSGPQSISCKFSPNGSIISGCNGLSILRTSNTNFGYGYGYNFNFGYGYGYTQGKLQYKITLDTSNLQAGIYTSNLIVKVANQIFSQQGSSLIINNPIETNQNTNSNSDNNNNGCFTLWICSAWSSCTDSVQQRTCEKEIKYCAASKIPETSRQCTIDLSQSNSNLNNDGKDIKDYEVSQDQLKANPPSFNSITGAVIGVLGNPLGLGAIVFIILVISLALALYLVRRR